MNKGAFEEKPLVYSTNEKCPKCKSKDVIVLWRDAVWEETGFQCKKCSNTWWRG